MTVRSKPMGDTKDSAIITQGQLKKQRGAIERWSAFVVLFLSFLGSVVAFHGGWLPLINSLRALQPNWAMLIIGIGLQAGLTYLEWHYFDNPLIAWPARLVDAATTALGYGPLVHERLTLALTPEAAQQVPEAIKQWGIASWCIIGLISLIIAWYPENRLVD